MKNFKNITTFLTSAFILFSFLHIGLSEVSAYSFGTYPEDNNGQETLDLEKKYGVKNDIVGFIYDSFTENDAKSFKRQVELLGKDRIYHVSISPFGYSAKQVSEGGYDDQYIRFFKLVKELGIKVLFRTGHEMNGSWYSWSGDPESFKKMWIRVHRLSRQNGLNTSNILFIFSVNSQNLPSDGKGGMIFCSPDMKKKTNCLTFENYYPGNSYVDLMGMTLYNWGRGRGEDWAKWRTFDDLLNDNHTKIFKTLKSYGKRIFLDEVGTTAVDFKGEWTNNKAKEVYKNEAQFKNEWLDGMRKTLKKNPEIAGVLYFNRDKTNGLEDRHAIGELDWSAVSLRLGKEYKSVWGFYDDSNIKTLPFTKNKNKIKLKSKPNLKK